MMLTTVLITCLHCKYMDTLRWRHNGCDSVSNHQPHDCLLNRLFRRRSKKTSKLRVTGLCAGNSPETGEFSAQMASNAENVSIWWRHHVRIGCEYPVWYHFIITTKYEQFVAVVHQYMTPFLTHSAIEKGKVSIKCCLKGCNIKDIHMMILNVVLGI